MNKLLLARLPLLLLLYAVSWWQELDLTRKLAGAASCVVVFGMAFIAAFAANHAEHAIVHRFAVSTALYMDSFISPRVQELASKATLSEANRQALDNLLAPTAVGRPVVGFRIWAGDHIVYSNHRDLIGKHFPPTDARSRAGEGHVAAELDQFNADDEVHIFALSAPILEIYAPIRETSSGRIVAIAETYEIATDLKREVQTAWLLIWLVFAALSAAMISLLFSLVAHLSRENEQYRARVGGANRRVSEMNELHMRRVGAELQNGPVQLVSLALLKLDSLRELIARADLAGHPKGKDVETIRHALSETLRDMRGLSASLLPSKIARLSLADALITAVRRHERRTGVPVPCTIGQLPTHVPFSLKACIYRLVQDVLADGCGGCSGREVSATCDGDVMQIEILAGPQAGRHGSTDCEQRLAASRDRVEAMGGVFLVGTCLDTTSVTARFQLCEVEAAHGG